MGKGRRAERLQYTIEETMTINETHNAVYKLPLCSLLAGVLLILAHPSRAIETIAAPREARQGCPLMFGDIPVNIFLSRAGRNMFVELVPVKDRYCLRVKALRLVNPTGKKLKPKKLKPKRKGGTHVTVGVGRRSGGSTGVGILVAGAPGGGYSSGSNGYTYRFGKGLPDGRLGTGWIWTIKAYDACRDNAVQMRIPADELVPCEEREPSE